MDAHETLMTALYKAVLQGGAGLGRTELMRQTFSTIEELRGFGSTWSFLASRIERVRQHGIETPPPTADELNAHVAAGPARAAFVRIGRTVKESDVSLAFGAAPSMTAAESSNSAGSFTSAPNLANAAAPSQAFFRNLQQLNRSTS